MQLFLPQETKYSSLKICINHVCNQKGAMQIFAQTYSKNIC